MNARLFSPVMLAAALMAGSSAYADTVVATINGYYDVDNYDTPSLHINNTTPYAFSDVNLTLTVYQGLNVGKTQGLALSDVAAGSTGIVTWGSIPGVSGSSTPGNLFAYDYDDEYGGTFAAQGGYGLSASHTVVPAPQCGAVGVWGDCAQVGNFYVTFTAMWNGKQVYSQFSPDPTLPQAGNAAGMFVGWEGLNPDGWSETTYDSHSNGGPNGVLADIFLGTPPVTTPEPGSLFLLATGLLLGMAMVKRGQR